MNMKILTIRQPFASALLTGAYDAERRKFRLSGPTLIHAAMEPGMSPPKAAEWLSGRDPEAARMFAWLDAEDDSPAPSSALAGIMLDSVAELGEAFPFGVVVGYVADWEPVREGLEWANRPVGVVHFPVSTDLPQHRGALGQLPCPQKIIDSVGAWIP